MSSKSAPEITDEQVDRAYEAGNIPRSGIAMVHPEAMRRALEAAQERTDRDLQRMSEAYLSALVVIRNPGLRVVLYSRWAAMEVRAKDIVRRRWKTHA